MSTNSTSPAILFGGTWTKIEGRFLWATGSTPGTTGGSRTTDAHVLTVDEIPSHSHALQVWNKNDSGSLSRWGINDLVWYNNILGEGKTNYWVGGTTNTGGGQGHTHTFMPPYFEVYMWYRTA